MAGLRASPADIGWMAMLTLAHGREVTSLAAAAATAAGSPATRARKKREAARARRAEKARAGPAVEAEVEAARCVVFSSAWRARRGGASAVRARLATAQALRRHLRASLAAPRRALPSPQPQAQPPLAGGVLRYRPRRPLPRRLRRLRRPQPPCRPSGRPLRRLRRFRPPKLRPAARRGSCKPGLRLEGCAAPRPPRPRPGAPRSQPPPAALLYSCARSGRLSHACPARRRLAALGSAALLAATLRLLLSRGASAPPTADAAPAAPRAGSDDEAAGLEAEEPEGDEVGDAMRAPVLRGSALAVRRAGAASWQDFLVLLRADKRLYLRDPTGGAAEELPLHGAVAAHVDGEPQCFSLQTQAEACFVRCRNKGEAEGWVRAINDTALLLGAPLVAQMGGGLAPPPPQLRTPMAAQASYSTSSDEEEEDGMMMGTSAPPGGAGGRMVPHGWATARSGARGGVPALRGVMLASRALLGVAVAPVRVSAALVILPFAMAAHGVAAIAGSARAALGGGGGGAVLDPAAESERRTGDASNPGRAPLLDRYLGECLDSSVHERVLDTALSAEERAAQEIAWARARAYDPDAAAAGAAPVPLSDLRRAAPARPVLGSAANSPREEVDAPAHAEGGAEDAAPSFAPSPADDCVLDSASTASASAPRSPEIVTTPRSLALMTQSLAHGGDATGAAPSPSRAAQLLSSAERAPAGPEAIALAPPGDEATDESAGKVAKKGSDDVRCSAAACPAAMPEAPAPAVPAGKSGIMSAAVACATVPAAAALSAAAAPVAPSAAGKAASVEPAASKAAAAVVDTVAPPAASKAAAAEAAPGVAPVVVAPAQAAPVVAPGAPVARPATALPVEDASLADTLVDLLRVDADAARATVATELGPVFEHGSVCFCGAA